MMKSLDEYLENLDEQKEVKDAEIVISENPKLKLIFEKYEEWNKFRMPMYQDCVKLLAGINCTAKDVRDLSIAFRKYDGDPRFEFHGIFLSYLINTSEEYNFDVYTKHLNTKISYLGFHNKKNLTIIGAVNNWTGQEMEKGLIIVKGDVNGLIGNHMRGGQIKIIGNIKGGGTGHLSEGGEIYVEGNMYYDYLNHHNRSKARICHKGELVWPKE